MDPNSLPTIKQLAYFAAILEAGSYRRAADKLLVSQPTLTAQITTLEEKLGCRLIERSRTGAIPTPAGRELVSLAKAVVRDAEDLKSKAEGLQKGPAGTHRLGVPPTLGPYLLPAVVPEWHRSYPNLRLFVREGAPRDLEEALMHGDMDLIMTPLPIMSSELTVKPLFNEALELVVAVDHPLVRRKRISSLDLKGENILAIEEKHHLFEQVSALVRHLGANLLRDYEGTSLDTLRQMVGMGLGVAFLPSLYVKSEIRSRAEVVPLRVNDLHEYRTIAMIWRPNAPYAAVYAEMARKIRAICLEMGETITPAAQDKNNA